MQDTLYTRFPGEPIKHQVGRFEKVDLNRGDLEGFVVCDYRLENNYKFIEGSGDTVFHKKSNPVVVDKPEYLLQGEELKSGIINNKLSKAILSRVKNAGNIEDPVKLFHQLDQAYPSAFIYLISSQEFGTWIGATPETLIEHEGSNGQTMSLAGTLPVNEGEWSQKEIEEQRYVTEFIEGKLIHLGMSPMVEEVTESIAGPVRHLKSDITFTCDRQQLGRLVQSLHPTPAVSGMPREESMKLIDSVEKHDRQLYAGVIGRIEEHSRLFVNLRCAQLCESGLFLYLGGGYTKYSVIESEWDETENKAKTLLSLLNN